MCLTKHQVARRTALRNPKQLTSFVLTHSPHQDDLASYYFNGVVYYIQNIKKYLKLVWIPNTEIPTIGKFV